MTALGFLLAAVAGTLVRAVASGRDSRFNRRMVATLAVNVVGAFLLGWLQGTDAATLTAVGVGGLGALTTFSTFVAQIECIAREGRRRDAVAYAVATLLLGLLAAAAGYAAT
jgi:CrcB protein